MGRSYLLYPSPFQKQSTSVSSYSGTARPKDILYPVCRGSRVGCAGATDFLPRVHPVLGSNRGTPDSKPVWGISDEPGFGSSLPGTKIPLLRSPGKGFHRETPTSADIPGWKISPLSGTPLTCLRQAASLRLAEREAGSRILETGNLPFCSSSALES